MFKRTTRWMTTAALVVTALTACTDSPGPTELILPLDGGVPADQVTSSFYDLYNTELTSDGASLYSSSTGARLLTTDTPVDPAVTIAVVGPEGGTISAGVHALEIPRNAVSEPTEFTIETVGGSHIIVDLSARSVQNGQSVSAFPVPLTLTLSYKGLIKNSEARRLRNVYLFQNSPNLLVPLYYTLNQSDKSLSSPIWHFSQYGMAIE